MNAERWQRLEAVYHGSLERPASEREAFIAAACAGDEALRLEVEALVAAAASHGERLETPFLDAAARELADRLVEPDAPRTVGRYQLGALLGTGGMGQVFEAWDPLLERTVALKLLHRTDAAAPSRLLVEARAAARVAHPHVCAVYEVGEQHGQPFIVTELVDGTTLADVVSAGPVPQNEAVAVVLALAAAVGHAHECGVLHRDLTTRNVMLTGDGTVKVLDFGLAKRVADGGAGTAMSRTGIGRPVGTLSYMAPELLRGEPATAQTDVWALGVILFELLGGARPFQYEEPLEVVSAILRDPPPPLPATVHSRLARIAARALEKDRSARYADVASLRRDLAAAQGDMAGARRPLSFHMLALPASLVVLLSGTLWVTSRVAPQVSAATDRGDVAILPLRSVGQSDTPEYRRIAFPDLIGRELTAAGTGIDVRSVPKERLPTAASADSASIARDLGVTHIVRGTLGTSPRGYRISLELDRAADGGQTWTDNYEIGKEQLESYVPVMAAQIARALGRPFPLGSAGRPRTNPEAFDEFLRGRAELIRHARPNLLNTVRIFEHVLDLDPAYAPAYAALALACARVYYQSPAGAMDEWAERATRSATRALRLNPLLADAHQARAAVYRYNESNWRAAISESLLALQLDSSLEMPHYHLSVAFYHLGLFDRADRAALAGLERNPFSRFEGLHDRGRAAFYGGRPADARRLLEEAASLGDGRVEWVLAEALYYTDDKRRAEDMLRGLLSSGSGVERARAKASLAAFYAADGRSDDAEQMLKAALSGTVADHHQAYRIGTAHAQLGRLDEAVRWLRKAADDGFPCYGWYASDRLLEPLRDHAGYRSLLVRLRVERDAYAREYGHLYAAQ